MQTPHGAMIWLQTWRSPFDFECNRLASRQASTEGLFQQHACSRQSTRWTYKQHEAILQRVWKLLTWKTPVGVSKCVG